LEKQRVLIKPPAAVSLNLKEYWQYRELLYFFAWRDVKVKYKQTSLGIGWAVLQPLLLTFLFTFLFSRTIPFPAGPKTYGAFVLSGIVVWNLFQATATSASESIISQSEIIKKIYFPRLLIPTSKLVVSLLDFIITLVMLLLYCLIIRQPLSLISLICIPASILLTAVGALALGVLLSALVVRFRDIRYVVPFLVQFLFFASGIVYPASSVSPIWLRYLLALNPVNGAIELFRMSFHMQCNTGIIAISIISCVALLMVSVYYFQKTERFFADLS
jgi:lipopolysaccharide transport system permease protein